MPCVCSVYMTLTVVRNNNMTFLEDVWIDGWLNKYERKYANMCVFLHVDSPGGMDP